MKVALKVVGLSIVVAAAFVASAGQLPDSGEHVMVKKHECVDGLSIDVELPQSVTERSAPLSLTLRNDDDAELWFHVSSFPRSEASIRDPAAKAPCKLTPLGHSYFDDATLRKSSGELVVLKKGDSRSWKLNVAECFEIGHGVRKMSLSVYVPSRAGGPLKKVSFESIEFRCR